MFSSSPILILSLQLLAHARFSSANWNKLGALDINEYLLGESGDYRDHEIFSVEEGLEEDIIYVAKREPPPSLKDCSDCDDFTPWDETDTTSILGRSTLVSVASGLNATQSVPLIPRNDKNVKTKEIECGKGKTIKLESYTYPTNEQLAKMTGNKIYDFKPFDRPDQAGYYQLKSISAFQLRAGHGTFTNRAVSVEHILEWQVLLDFIVSDVKRCEHIVDYFNEDVDINTVWTVKGAPDVDAKWTERGIDWVTHQYPGAKATRSPFSYEFVSLHDGVNTRKEKLWSEGSSRKKKGPGAATKPDLVSDDKWTRWTEKNQYQNISPSKTGSKRPSKTWTLSPNNEGKCQAVVALRDIIGVYRYHSYPEVQEVMTAQINRIGTAFKYLEQGPLKKLPGGYVPMANSLESQWNTYIKSRYASVISEIESTMKTLSADLGKAKVKRSWLSRLKRGTGSSAGPFCGQEKDKQKMNDRIDLLIKEYEAVKGKWKNPMP